MPGRVHDMVETVAVPPDTRLIIEPGATLRFAPGVSLLIRGAIEARGTAEAPIRFTSADGENTWGVLAINSISKATNHFRHCLFERSANAVIHGVPFTGALAPHSSPCEVEKCVFRDIEADDAFNSKYVSPRIVGCVFSNNLDAIDIDFGGGVVADCEFRNNQDDCIDLSSSWATIEGNRLVSGGDKGVSVGEKSRPRIFNNLIEKAAMGIAVKDLSDALILNNTIINNRVGVALYEKKPSFGPGRARLVNNLLRDNGMDITTDAGSAIRARFNALSAKVSGEGNLSNRGDEALSRGGSGEPLSDYGWARTNRLERIGHYPE